MVALNPCAKWQIPARATDVIANILAEEVKIKSGGERWPPGQQLAHHLGNMDLFCKVIIYAGLRFMTQPASAAGTIARPGL